jgi:hypothetical protein
MSFIEKGRDTMVMGEAIGARESCEPGKGVRELVSSLVRGRERDREAKLQEREKKIARWVRGGRVKGRYRE